MRLLLLTLLIFKVMISTNAQITKVVVTIDINVSVEEAFEYIVPVDLPHIFKRYKNLPAIKSTSNTERWYTPGMQRTVYFEDGNTAQEFLLTVNPHSHFSYKIIDFTSPLKRLAKRIEGRWSFTESQKGDTHIEWTYEIIPKNFLTKMMINLFVKKM